MWRRERSRGWSLWRTTWRNEAFGIEIEKHRSFDSRLNCLLRRKRRNVFGCFAQDDRFFFLREIGGGSRSVLRLKVARGLKPNCIVGFFGPTEVGP